MIASQVTVSAIILTYRRDDALAETLRRLQPHMANRPNYELILIDNNADGADRSYLLSNAPDVNVRLITPGSNLGVAKGRNLGIREANGEYLVFLDDDALVEGNFDFMGQVEACFTRDKALGAIAFRIWDRRPYQYDPIEFPHTNKLINRYRPFETFRFIGAGHALRKEALDMNNLYPEHFFYGMEEFELCMRLMKADWKIVYDPTLTVTHAKAETGRLAAGAVVERMYANKLYIAWSHLPFKEAAICSFMWGCKTLQDSGSIKSVFRSIANFLNTARSTNFVREPSPVLVKRIRNLGGTPWK